jgi:hypothetical protein
MAKTKTRTRKAGSKSMKAGSKSMKAGTKSMKVGSKSMKVGSKSMKTRRGVIRYGVARYDNDDEDPDEAERANKLLKQDIENSKIYGINHLPSGIDDTANIDGIQYKAEQRRGYGSRGFYWVIA